MSNKDEFLRLRAHLNMTLEELVPYLRKSLGTLKRYSATGDSGLEPPDVVIQRLRDTVRCQAFEALEAARCSVRFRDYDRMTEVRVEYEDFRYDPEDDECLAADRVPLPVVAQPPAPRPSGPPPTFRRPSFLTAR